MSENDYEYNAEDFEEEDQAIREGVMSLMHELVAQGVPKHRFPPILVDLAVLLSTIMGHESELGADAGLAILVRCKVNLNHYLSGETPLGAPNGLIAIHDAKAAAR